MSVLVIAVATESGVPIFSRKRGNSENIQFSTIASLHGINMFSKCHNLSIVNTQVDNGNILWREYCKSVTLIGLATGGLECDLDLLLSTVHNLMIFCIGKKELENLKNIDQIKRDLRQCYPILDYLLESLDPDAVLSPHPTLVLDLIQSILCPQAQQLQQALDNYAENVTGRWACLCIHGHLIATSSDFNELDPREARLLLLLAASQDGAPLRDTPVYLPQISPNIVLQAGRAVHAQSNRSSTLLAKCSIEVLDKVGRSEVIYTLVQLREYLSRKAGLAGVNMDDVPFRAVTCKLLADVYILVVCGATPALSQIDEIVLQCWEGYAQVIKDAKVAYPRNFPMSVSFEPCVLGILLINISKHKCVFSRHLHAPNQKTRGMSGAHKIDILRTFYVTTARDLAPEFKIRDIETKDKPDGLSDMCETYWCSEYHKCHAQRVGDLLCCVLYGSSVPTHTMRLITNQMLQDLSINKDIHW